MSNEELNLNEIRDYYVLLQKHDWFFQYSDCSRTYKKGAQEREVLVAATELSKAHKKLYEDYVYFINTPDCEPPNIENEEYWQ